MESLTTMQLKTYYKMRKHRGNDEGQSGVLPVVVVQATVNDDVQQEKL